MEITTFRQALHSKYGSNVVAQILPITPYDLAKDNWDLIGTNSGPTSIIQNTYSSQSRTRQSPIFYPGSINYEQEATTYRGGTSYGKDYYQY